NQSVPRPRKVREGSCRLCLIPGERKSRRDETRHQDDAGRLSWDRWFESGSLAGRTRRPTPGPKAGETGVGLGDGGVMRRCARSYFAVLARAKFLGKG